LDRLGQSDVGFTNHELDPAQAALFERDQEFAPEALAIAIAELETQQLAANVSIDAHGHHHSPGADLQRLAHAAVEVTGIEVDVRVTALLQGPAAERICTRTSMPPQMRLT
jgi:hypothetical protein